MLPSFLRHAAEFDSSAACTVCLVGVGATGSLLAMALARLGFVRFQIWDPDVVEAHNLPNQLFYASDIGSLKVDAVEKHLKSFNPEIICDKHPDYFKPSEDRDKLPEDSILFIGVDSLSTRREMPQAFRNNVDLLSVIETRVGFKHAEIYVVDHLSTAETEQWVSTIPDENKVEESPCNARIIPTLVNMVASTAAHYIMQICKKKFPTRHTLISLDEDLQVYNIRPHQ